jgi:hypothetical protein
MKVRFGLCVFLLLGASLARAQIGRDEQGFEVGGFYFRPDATARAAYDDRVVLNAAKTDAEGDLYGELSAGVRINNLPARYDLLLFGFYGYRVYDKFSGLDDDFYRLNASVGNDDDRLRWKLGGDAVKRLNYNTVYNTDTGDQPDSILVNEPNRRYQARGEVSYAVPFSEKTIFVPEYIVTHYRQEFEVSGETAEWLIHRVNLPLKYAVSDKAYVLAGGTASLQDNKDDNGRIITAYTGLESRATDKTSYEISVGYSAADYEMSGEDHGFVSDARVVWEPTDKVRVFVSGGNRFQPGYGGRSARMVYRAGYGVAWEPVDRWFFDVQGLHDYEEAIGSSAAGDYGDVRHFFTGRVGYALVRWAELGFAARYVIDEIDVNQTVLSCQLDLYL